MRIKSVSRAAFAAAMIWLGVLGLMKGGLPPVWAPVPKWVPAQAALVYLCAFVSLGCGVGLLFQRSAAAASRVLLAALAFWLLAFRLLNLFYQKPLVLVGWSFGATAVMMAAAWVLYIELAGERDRARLGPIADARGLRVARALFGVSLVPFGLAHFMYLDATTVLIPAWIPFHVACAYLTGSAFIAAGLAVAAGVLPRLAARLVTLQMTLFGLIVWVPRVITGNLSEFQRGEFVTTFVLAAGAWVIAESCAPSETARSPAL